MRTSEYASVFDRLDAKLVVDDPFLVVQAAGRRELDTFRRHEERLERDVLLELRLQLEVGHFALLARVRVRTAGAVLLGQLFVRYEVEREPRRVEALLGVDLFVDVGEPRTDRVVLCKVGPARLFRLCVYEVVGARGGRA